MSKTNDIDWVWVGKLIEAADSARALGFSVGTTNWGAHIYRAVSSARQLAEQGARPLTTRELADVTAPWAHIWTDQSFGIANAAIAKFCEVNGIAARPLTASPTAPSTEASEPVRDERAEFEAHFKNLDFTMDKDGWGRPVYVHPHVYSLWDGWQARALKGTP